MRRLLLASAVLLCARLDALAQEPEPCTVGFDYTFEMPGNLIGDTSFGLDYYKMDDYLTAATNDFHNSGWDIVNGFVAMNLGESWELRLTGKNLSDDVIVTSGSRGLGGFVWLPPREFLFQVTYRMPQ